MKVGLINPASKDPYLSIPHLGLAYLGAILKKNNYDVSILDLSVFTNH